MRLLEKLEESGGEAAVCEGLAELGTTAMIDDEALTAVAYFRQGLERCDDKPRFLRRLSRATGRNIRLCREAALLTQQYKDLISTSVPGRLSRARNELLCGSPQAARTDVDWIATQQIADLYGPHADKRHEFGVNIIMFELSTETGRYESADRHLLQAVEEYSNVGLTMDLPDVAAEAIRARELGSGVAMSHGYSLCLPWLMKRVLQVELLDRVEPDQRTYLADVAATMSSVLQTSGREAERELASHLDALEKRFRQMDPVESPGAGGD